MTRNLYCQECQATFTDVGGGDRIFCDQHNEFVDVRNCPLITTEEHMKILRTKEAVIVNENAKEGVPAVSEYAPKKPRDVATVPPNKYLTDDMISSAASDAIDALRLTQITAPAVEQIGMSTAVHIDDLAKLLVDHTKSGAQQLVDDAHRQADKMVREAEDAAQRLTEFANSIRTYSMSKSEQVSKFCSISENIMGSMYALGDHFITNRREEIEAARNHEEPLEPPSFLQRKPK